MIPAPNYAGVLHELDMAFQFRRVKHDGDRVRMVGILFARPELPLAHEQLLGGIEYWHHRSGTHFDLFWAGYGRYWPSGEVRDARPVVLADPPWLYSASAFDKFRAELESKTTWQYSGECDLLLLKAVYDHRKAEASFDFSDAVSIHLEQAIKDNAIVSMPRFFERLMRLAEHTDGLDPTWGVSDHLGGDVARSALIGVVNALLPPPAREAAKHLKAATHFAVRDIRK
jgi:hypothetical protein